MANFFDQFDPPKAGNFFDQFDPPVKSPDTSPRSQWENFKAGVQAVIQDPKHLLTSVGPAKWAQDAVKGAVSGVTLPGDVYTGKAPIGQFPSDMTPEQGMRVAELAGLGVPINPSVRAGYTAIPAAKQVVVPGEKQFVTEAVPLSASRELPAPGAPIIDQTMREITTPPTISYEPTLRAARPAPPTQEALFKSGDEQFKAIRKMGVEYKADAVAATAARTRQALEEQSLLRQNASATHGILDDLASPPPNSTAPLDFLMVARESLNNIAFDNRGKREGKAAVKALKDLDAFIERAGTPSGSSVVVAGPATEAAGALRSARGNWAAGRRSERLTKAEEYAELRAEKGGHLGDKIRDRAAWLLNPEYPKRRSGFSPEEIAALEYVNKGGHIERVARSIGKILGGGPGIKAQLSALATGTAVGGGLKGFLAGAGVVGAGMGSRKISDVLTARALRSADKLVRSRSPLHELAPDVALGPPSSLPIRSLSLLGLEEAREPLEITVHPSGWVR